MLEWSLIGWPVAIVIGVVIGARRKPRSPNVQREEDREQAANLREWSDRRQAYQKAKARGDTRKMAERWPALRDATNAKLKAGR